MRLNWFSPLPPAQTDIANYTARILPTLRERAEITLWTDQARWDPMLETFAEVHRYQPEKVPWAELNRAHVSIYNIGNHPTYHSAIWQVSRHHSGVVILHEISLQHFFSTLYRERFDDPNGYLAQMERHYGRLGYLRAKAFWNGLISVEQMAEHYPLTPLAVEKALGVIVHTQDGFKHFNQENYRPSAYLPLPYAASPWPKRSRSGSWWQRATGPPYTIVVFGHSNPYRRLDALLKALAEFPDKDRFRLHILGSLSYDGHLRAQVRSLGLRRLVKLRGFVSEVRLDRALADADLAVNLRYPTMGEASGGQLRIWDHALPALVTRAGWYSSLPEDAVAFVRPEHEIADIQAHLTAFLANPDRFRKMGQNGRRILEEHHSPSAYVRAIFHFFADAARLRLYNVAHELAKRVGTELNVWTGPTASDELLRKAAEEILALTNSTMASKKALWKNGF